MSKLTNQIREYVRCPQFDGGTEYGEWGALRLDQRRLIRELCERCEEQEKYADTFFKETQSLKHQLAEKDEVIERLKDKMETWKSELFDKLTEVTQTINDCFVEIDVGKTAISLMIIGSKEFEKDIDEIIDKFAR